MEGTDASELSNKEATLLSQVFEEEKQRNKGASLIKTEQPAEEPEAPMLESGGDNVKRAERDFILSPLAGVLGRP